MEQKSLRSYVEQIDKSSQLDLIGILDDLKLTSGSIKAGKSGTSIGSKDIGTQCNLLLELEYHKLPKLPAPKVEEKDNYLLRRHIHSDGRTYISTTSHRKSSRQLYDRANHYLEDVHPKDDERTVFSLMRAMDSSPVSSPAI
jgi:hypothetical protein